LQRLTLAPPALFNIFLDRLGFIRFNTLKLLSVWFAQATFCVEALDKAQLGDIEFPGCFALSAIRYVTEVLACTIFSRCYL